MAAAVRARYPEARSVIELGGQDAKLIWFEGERAHMSMNDRCAAGTGVTIERCLRRLGLEGAAEVAYDAAAVRPVSAKCGVFAETDSVNLARAGAGPVALVSSLADAIVVQNLAVLARGMTPEPCSILLGGPHVYLPALAGAWRRRLGELWRDRGIVVPDQPVRVPEHGRCCRPRLVPACWPRSATWKSARARPRSSRRCWAPPRRWDRT